MTYKQALSYIHSTTWLGSKPGLSRTRRLLSLIGNPQDRLKFIHVAGTNGKGSFCAMLSSVLKHAGYRVGTYTSPYILRFNERMQIMGKPIPDETLAELVSFIQPFADAMEDKPTEFELITAIAMKYFADRACDVVVLECGMGGRLDSTNVIETSILSVITGISLDHTAFLGNTVEEIAREKAGIIKPGVPILFCQENQEAERVIRGVANEKNAPFFTVDKKSLSVLRYDLFKTVFSFGAYRDLSLSLLGSYQPENACHVLRALEMLSERGYTFSETAVREGLSEVRWPARFEIISRDPLILFDGGHNPEGVDRAVESIRLYFGDQKVFLLCGVMKDKDYSYMVKRMAEIAEGVFCITPENPRALSAEEFALCFRGQGVSAWACENVQNALASARKKAKEENRPLFCLGSLYMYGQIYTCLLDES